MLHCEFRTTASSTVISQNMRCGRNWGETTFEEYTNSSPHQSHTFVTSL
jgi:hypothetical protein